MSKPLDPFRRSSVRETRRMRLADRRRRPALERLEDLVLLANVLVVTTTAATGSSPLSLDQAIRDADSSNRQRPRRSNSTFPGPGRRRSWSAVGTGSRLPDDPRPDHLRRVVGGRLPESDDSGHLPGPAADRHRRDGCHDFRRGRARLRGTVVQRPGARAAAWSRDWTSSTGNSSPPRSAAGQRSRSRAAHGESTVDVTIQGNYIGVGPDGTTLEGNDVYGIGVRGRITPSAGRPAPTQHHRGQRQSIRRWP